MNETLLDKVYIDTKDKVKTLFKESFLLNFISNESDNIKGKRILNMTIFTKDYHTFYVFSKSAENKPLNTTENSC